MYVHDNLYIDRLYIYIYVYMSLHIRACVDHKYIQRATCIYIHIHHSVMSPMVHLATKLKMPQHTACDMRAHKHASTHAYVCVFKTQTCLFLCVCDTFILWVDSMSTLQAYHISEEVQGSRLAWMIA